MSSEHAQRIAKIASETDELHREMVDAIVKYRKHQVLLAETMSEVAKAKEKDEDPILGPMVARVRSTSFWLEKIAHAKYDANLAVTEAKAMGPAMATKSPSEAKSILMSVQNQLILHEVYKAILHADRERDPPPSGLATVAETHEETPAVPQ